MSDKYICGMLQHGELDSCQMPHGAETQEDAMAWLRLEAPTVPYNKDTEHEFYVAKIVAVSRGKHSYKIKIQ